MNSGGDCCALCRTRSTVEEGTAAGFTYSFVDETPMSSTASLNCSRANTQKRAFASISTCVTWTSSLPLSLSPSQLPNIRGTCRKLLRNRLDNSERSFCKDWPIFNARQSPSQLLFVFRFLTQFHHFGNCAFPTFHL